jgi:tetratricopeptide (TPR) repeat protein
VAYDDDLQKGLRDLEDILHRLDDRAQDRLWLKERAQRKAQEGGAAKEAEPQPFTAPAPETAPEFIAPAKAAETPVVIPRMVPPPEAPPAFPPATPPVFPQATPPVMPAPIVPPPVKTPEPVVKAPEPAAKAPEPVKPTEKPAPEPAKLPEKTAPAPEPKPAAKPARKPFTLNKHVFIYFGVGLAIAGGAYQLTANSAAARYARAGKLVETARLTEAISAYTRIIEGHKGSPQAAYSQFAIGDIKAVQGDLTEAIDRYEHFLLAAPAKDAKIPQAKFNIAEIEFKQNNFPDAEFMYNSPDIQGSTYAVQAADRLKEIKIINGQITGARKLMAKDPAKAAAAFSAVLAVYPGLNAAVKGLDEAQKALAAANLRRADKAATAAKAKAARVAKTAAAKAPRKPIYTPMFSKEQLEACNAVWLTEKIQVPPDAETTAARQNNDCNGLKDHISACKWLQSEYAAIQNLKPEARALIEQETKPDWTPEKQTAQDKRTLKSYEFHHCAELVKVIAP